MDFSELTIQRFKAGIDVLNRTYQVDENRDGKISLRNVIDGKIWKTFNKSEVTIHGNPLKNIQDLQKIVFNQSCICEGEMDDSEYKIFDLTFDNTFE